MHIAYVAALPCEGAVGFQYPFNCKFTKKSFSDFFLNRLRFDRKNYGNEPVAPLFGPPCILPTQVHENITKQCSEQDRQALTDETIMKSTGCVYWLRAVALLDVPAADDRLSRKSWRESARLTRVWRARR